MCSASFFYLSIDGQSQASKADDDDDDRFGQACDGLEVS